MPIEDIIKETDIAKRVAGLKKGRLSDSPTIEKYKKQWDPYQHEIFNPVTRPDKTVWYNKPDDAEDAEPTLSRIEYVARLCISMQKLIVKRAASFLFGNPVKTISSEEGSVISEAVDRILRDNKQNSLNRKVARILFSSTEVAEYWYPRLSDEKFSTYGFETDLKIKCAIFSPLKGDTLYPYFNEQGDMVAFSREYKVKEDDKDVTYFETWTNTQYFKVKQVDSGWVEALDGKPTKIQLGKIPIVYACQESVEWADVQNLIERLETLLSTFADIVSYNAAPKNFVTGKVLGFSKKGEAGVIIQGEEGADIKVLSWDQAPEAVRLEIETLFRLIFTLTQTPDISFEAVKGMGSAASGNSLRMLFLDPHLKVMDKMEIFDDYLQRRLNILKAFVGIMSSKTNEAAKIELTPEVIPFMVDDEKDKIDNLVTAVSGGIMSKETAVSQNPLVEDVKGEMDLIKSEAAEGQAIADKIAGSPEGLDELQNQE